MKKRYLASLLLLTTGMLVGCNSTGEESSNAENSAPSIIGVEPTQNYIVGESYDLMEGITGYDAEDGDLTSSVKVSISETTGYDLEGTTVTFSESGTYNIEYTLSDSEGLEAESQWITATVTQNFTPIKTYEFKDSELTNKFELGEGTKGALAQGSVYKVNAPADKAGAVSLKDQKLANGLNYTYTVNFAALSAGATVTAKLMSGETVLATSEAVSAPADVAAALPTLTLTYKAAADDATASLTLELSQGAEIQISSIVCNEMGESTEQVDKFDGKTLEGTTKEDQDGVTSSEAKLSEDKKSASIDILFNNSVDSWKTHFYINTGLTLEAGREYTISYDVTGTAAQQSLTSFLGNKNPDDKGSGEYRKDFTLDEGALTKTITHTIVPTSEIADMSFYIQCGNGTGISGGKQTLTFSNLKVMTSAATQTQTTTDFSATHFNMYTEGEHITASVYDDAVNYYVDANVGGGDGGQKVKLSNVELKAGVNYQVRVTYSLDKQITSNFIVRDPSVSNWDRSLITGAAAYNVVLNQGENQSYTSNVFTPIDDYSNVDIQFHIGQGDWGEQPVPYTLSIEKIELLSDNYDSFVD